MPTLFVKNLTVIDCSYLHPERGLVGESWSLNIGLSGELDQEGVIFDFALAKKAIKTWIDTHIDHTLILPQNSPLLEINSGETTHLYWKGTKPIQYTCPQQALCLVPTKEIHKAELEIWLQKGLMSILPPNIHDIHIDLESEEISGAYYHYTHGLKKHYGNCQRMCHGHKSALEIYLNQVRAPILEQIWSQRFADIYIASREDLAKTFHREGKEWLRFEYTAIQGFYALEIPAENVWLMDTDTTVEWIAKLICDSLAQENTGENITVCAYEGIGKGCKAIFEPQL